MASSDLEPRLGGRLYESFEGKGNHPGLRDRTVTDWEPRRAWRSSGAASPSRLGERTEVEVLFAPSRERDLGHRHPSRLGEPPSGPPGAPRARRPRVHADERPVVGRSAQLPARAPRGRGRCLASLRTEPGRAGTVARDGPARRIVADRRVRPAGSGERGVRGRRSGPGGGPWCPGSRGPVAVISQRFRRTRAAVAPPDDDGDRVSSRGAGRGGRAPGPHARGGIGALEPLNRISILDDPSRPGGTPPLTTWNARPSMACARSRPHD